MPRKLAITISGAVSLGIYVAGVLYEVVPGIGQHNNNQTTLPWENVFIDVFTSASAGDVTATIATQKLLHEVDASATRYENACYRPWTTTELQP